MNDSHLSLREDQTERVPDLRSRWKRRFSVLFIGLILFAFIKYGFLETWNYVGCDFDIFYTAASRIRDGETPYPKEFLSDPPPEDGAWGAYIYPALFARLLIPLTLLEPIRARHVYLGCCLALYVLLLVPWKKFGTNPLSSTVILFGLLFGWGPVLENFRLAQSNFFPLFAFCLAWKCLTWERIGTPTRREILAGILYGLGSMVKITPLLLVVPLMIAQSGKFLLGLFVGVSTGIVFSGLEASSDFFLKVLPSLSRFPDLPQTLSLATMVDREIGRRTDQSFLTGLGNISPGILCCGIVYAYVCGFVWLRRGSANPGNLVMLGCWLPTLLTGVWYHHYILAVLPLTRLVPRVFREGIRESRSADGLFSVRSSWKSLLLSVSLLPGFRYWRPVHKATAFFSTKLGVSSQELFLAGYFVAFFVLLPLLIPATPEEPRGSGSVPERASSQEAI